VGSLPAKDFPRLPETSALVFSEVDADVLRDMLDVTSFACTEVEGPLGGVNVEFGAEGRIMACDRARGALTRGTLGGIAMRTALVPRLALGTLMKAFADSKSVEVSASPAELFMRDGDTLMVAKLVDAEFPKAAPQMFREESDHFVTCDRERLIGALRRMMIVASKDLGAKTKIDVKPDLMRLSADGAGFGVAEDEIEVSYFGDGICRHFDAKLLVESLETMSSDEVILGIEDIEMAPMVVSPVSESSQRVILMPMRAQ
jgi:DNA polymerase III sliding clamp (beta) subunit (PCNA family)